GRSRPEPGAGGTARRLLRLGLRLDGALALTTDDLVGLGADPGDEVLQRLDVELDRKGDALCGLLERNGADAVEEVVERLAVVALLLVEPHPPPHTIRHH